MWDSNLSDVSSASMTKVLPSIEFSGGGSHCVIEISATWIRSYEYAADVSFIDLSNPPYSDDHDLSSENRRMP